MRRVLWMIFGVILVTSVVVGAGAACTGNSNNLNVDSSYSGKQVELSVGQSLVVTLDSNPSSTGYSWSLIQNSDESVLSKTGDKYIAPQTTTPMVGAPGVEEWTFKALKKGTSTISMGYSRPWESIPPVETFDLTVVVK